MPVRPSNRPRALRAAILAATAVALRPAPPLLAAGTEAPHRIAAAERVQVSLVLIDIVVRDRKDRPVRGLLRDDFRVTVDAAPIAPDDIESFEEVCGPAAPEAAAPAVASSPSIDPAPPSPPGAAPAVSPPGAAGIPAAARPIVIYFDFPHLTMAAARASLRNAREFVAHRLSPADRVMILAYKGGLRLVQDLTGDSAGLTSSLDAMMADRSLIDTDVMEQDKDTREVLETECRSSECDSRRAAASVRARREEAGGRRSLDALTLLMPALAGLRGRKAIVLYTETLRQEPGAEFFVTLPVTPRDEGISLEQEMLRLTREANAAQVSLYTVYAGGMTADDLGTDPLSVAHAAANDSALALQTTLAVETGGRALQRTNDLGAILDSAEADLSCYYLLGYRHLGRGDDRRHSIAVSLARGSGLTVRARPYYTDQSAGDRRDRLVQSALMAPELYRGIPVALEAFVMGPADGGRSVLVKASAPISRLPLLPRDDGRLEGRLALRGEVTAGDGARRCAFDQEVPLRVAPSEADRDRVVFENGCVLAPGTYGLSLLILDPVTLEIGARRAALTVPKPGDDGGVDLSDIHLWTRDPDALLVWAGPGAATDGRGVMAHGLIPQAQLRMRRDRDAELTVAVCLPDMTAARRNASHPGSREEPLRVSRTLTGEGGAVVSRFGEISLVEPPDPSSGCYQVSTAIPAGTLGGGIYTFTVEVSGGSLRAPAGRAIDLAVQ